jgi:hypothetical protein
MRPRAHRLLALGLLVAAPLTVERAEAQTTPRPCTALKGRVVAVEAKARSVTLDRGGRRDVLPVADVALAAVQELRPGDQVTLKMDCLVTPAAVIAVQAKSRPSGPAAGPTPVGPTAPRLTTLLLTAEAACALSVDFKPWGPLAAGARTELKLPPGEHMLEASTPDGRSWKEKVKVGSDQMIVEVKLSQPVATLAQYDAQAARVYGALQALKAAGRDLDEILKKKNFKFDKADSAAVSTAAAAWVRDLGVLKSLVAPPPRTRVTEDLAGLDPYVREYADLIEKALETAQKNYSVLGEATRLRGQAQARAELLQLPAETLALLQASPEFRKGSSSR